ncbi:hypothetical protein SLS62_006677 [Diatrype stigma]|uniref:Uncharacterized protein n=1 Tax=Diatrype stigma TaxID=117547 RepID=A0AAN9UP35_9PEZI
MAPFNTHEHKALAARDDGDAGMKFYEALVIIVPSIIALFLVCVLIVPPAQDWVRRRRERRQFDATFEHQPGAVELDTVDHWLRTAHNASTNAPTLSIEQLQERRRQEQLRERRRQEQLRERRRQELRQWAHEQEEHRRREFKKWAHRTRLHHARREQLQQEHRRRMFEPQPVRRRQEPLPALQPSSPSPTTSSESSRSGTASPRRSGKSFAAHGRTYADFAEHDAQSLPEFPARVKDKGTVGRRHSFDF